MTNRWLPAHALLAIGMFNWTTYVRHIICFFAYSYTNGMSNYYEKVSALAKGSTPLLHAQASVNSEDYW